MVSMGGSGGSAAASLCCFYRSFTSRRVHQRSQNGLWPRDIAGPQRHRWLEFDLLRYAEGIIHFDPQVANRTLQLGVAEQQLHGMPSARSSSGMPFLKFGSSWLASVMSSSGAARQRINSPRRLFVQQLLQHDRIVMRRVAGGID